MNKLEITCDNCNRDITYTGNCEDWRIVLGSEEMPAKTNVVTLMAVKRPIPDLMHFCGLKCLKEKVATLK